MKTKKQIIGEWIATNGGCDFDLKGRDIILYDGGLFSIEAKPIKFKKIIGYKNLPDGGRQVIFSKKKLVKSTEYKAYLWFEELNETINYLRRMKKMLNRIGFKTGGKEK